ncbi:cytochrome P450 [Pochonia chlamydosporia 170]|uniref:Cytochrome P450 n=1 Tax=Pochonia chlamydosporia 170 TaxID=1380566 RepID=A0A179F285_METCM|nr:cytochrome P450 [Pochonia chlamydosporia 170]OAQ59556.1 cytochrome P450 [Pochonia chlamydosporia 170]
MGPSQLLLSSIQDIGLESRLLVVVPCVIAFLFAVLNNGPLQKSWNFSLQKARQALRDKWDMFIYPIAANGRIKAAYSQMKGNALRINSPESWMTLVSSPELIKDIKNATNEQLSLHAAAKEILKPEYTMNGFNWHDQRGIEGIGFVRTLRTLLTTHLPKLTPGVRTIISQTFANEIKDGKATNVLQLSKKVVTKISAYAFFGADNLENNDFIDAAYYYNEDVLYGSELLRICPSFLRPIIGKFIPKFLTRQQTFFYGLVDIIENRMRNPHGGEKFNDVIQWIIDTSPKSRPWTPDRMAFEVMAIWFGSVQGLATTLTFVIYSLCEHPEYMEPLRAEIESLAGGEFLSSGDGLPLLDSFLKECSRWTPVESVTARRCALKDFTFSDGTRVAKGEWVGIPVGPMLRDPTKYPEPDMFDGFRFADPSLLGRGASTQPEGPSNFTDINEKWHVWGTGKLTCPGRFFVSYVMKHVMYHILENFEPEMEQKNRKYTVNWRTLTLPGPGVKANFHARV